jgi:sialic acid synthase SpsE
VIHPNKSDLLKAGRKQPGETASFSIGDKAIGKDSPTFIVAEGANNHLGDLAIARKMIDAAAQNGADAIKFQTFKAERLVVKDAPIFWKMPGVKTQLDFYKTIDKFGKKEFQALFRHAKKRRIVCFSTPFDCASADMLHELDMPAFKIASCDIPDLRLIRHVAGFGKPLFISTGASTLEEIRRVVDTAYAQGNFKIALLGCTLSYPTQVADMNLSRLTTFGKMFPGVIIGLSDHSEPDAQMILPSLAVALGAKVIEKHFTLSRKMPGVGHSFCIEPSDLRKMVENIRLTEKALGCREIKVYAAEENSRKNARRSLVANRKIRKGEKLSSAMIGIKRPGTGISPSEIDKVLGKIAKNDIEHDSQLTWKQLE